MADHRLAPDAKEGAADDDTSVHGSEGPATPTALPGQQPHTARAPRSRPERFRRVVVVATSVVLVVVLVAMIMVGYLAARVGSIGRVSVTGLHPAGAGSTQTILLTGSDSRAGETSAQAQRFGSAGQVGGQRSDVIVLIRLDPATGRAAMLSIPRDMFVPIAGTASSNRINVAFNTSPSVLVATIEQNFGIRINHVAEEDFSGLQGLTNAIGGVCLTFPFPTRDGAPTGTGNESGLNIPTAGPHTLDGAMGLALVRSRYYQYQENGAWRSEGTGDIGRIQRQHSFMRALASRAIHRSLSNPLTANAVLGRAVHEVKVDKTFTTIGMIRLGLHLRAIRPSAMPSFTMPYRAVSNYRGFGDVLLPDPGPDAAVVAAWTAAAGPAKGASPVTPPPSTPVRILNGSGASGQAQAAADGLKAAGFSISGIGTSPPSPRHSSTFVRYPPGQKPAAQELAGRLAGPVTLQADAQAGSEIVVVTGTGFKGVNAPAAAAAAAAPANPVPPWDPRPC